LPRIVGWLLLAHIGLPLVFGIVFIIIVAAVDPRSTGWDLLGEAALDFAILGLGATGSVFDNPKMSQAFPGANATLAAISVIAVNLVFAAVIVFIRASQARKSTRFTGFSSILSLFLGVLGVGFTASTLVWAYMHV